MAVHRAGTRVIPNVLTSSQEVAEKLTRRIFQEEFPKGAKLPSERELCEQYGVARNVVREAIKRLEATGVVQSWRGSGVYVKDIEFIRGIAMFDTLVTNEDGSVNLPFLREVVEFTDNYVRFTIRLAAIHRREEEVETLKTLVAAWEKQEENPEQLAALSMEIYRLLSNATHNRVCMGFSTSLERIGEKLFALAELTVLTFEQKRTLFRRLTEAIEEKDPCLAEAVLSRHLNEFQEKLAMGGLGAQFLTESETE